MPNAFFRAKFLWRAGDLEAAFLLLNDYLKEELGELAFKSNPRLFYQGAFARFELAVSSMLTDDTILQIPFGRVFSVIWKLDPNDIWIGVLLDYDFYHTDSISLFDDEHSYNMVSNSNDFEMLTVVLVDSAAKGVLGPEFDGPNNGRPILRIQDIEAVEESKWGVLKRMLLEHLPKAFADCPSDFWAQLAINEPDETFMRFLHDLFVEFNHPLDVAELRWKAIMRDHRDYAKAALNSLKNLLNENHDVNWLTEVVRIDAGFASVNDGAKWLKALEDALVQKDFRKLASS